MSFGPREEKLVRFHVHPREPQEGALFLTKPLLTAPSLFTMDTYFDADSPLEIWVSNIGDDYATILSGDKLGLLEAQTPRMYVLSNRQWCNLLRRQEPTEDRLLTLCTLLFKRRISTLYPTSPTKKRT